MHQGTMCLGTPSVKIHHYPSPIRMQHLSTLSLPFWFWLYKDEEWRLKEIFAYLAFIFIFLLQLSLATNNQLLSTSMTNWQWMCVENNRRDWTIVRQVKKFNQYHFIMRLFNINITPKKEDLNIYIIDINSGDFEMAHLY